MIKPLATIFAVACALLLVSTQARAASMLCTIDPSTLHEPYKGLWEKLGGDDGFLGCPLSQPIPTDDGQGTETRFKDGVIQYRQGSLPETIVVGTRGASLYVMVQPAFAVQVMAIATDLKSGTSYSGLMPSGGPIHIDKGMWKARAGTYEVTFEVCANVVLDLCSPRGARVGPMVTTNYSPYQIDLTRGSTSAAPTATRDVALMDRAKKVQRFQACRGFLKSLETEDQVLTLLAKLTDLNSTCPFEKETNFQQVTAAILAAKFNPWTGTQEDPIEIPVVGKICGRPGDYDAALWGLVRAGYALRESLETSPSLLNQADRERAELAYAHLLNVLLKPHGGVRASSWTALRDDCGITVPETENHIMLIESSRYLINQLVKRADPQAAAIYDNGTNGMYPWLMKHLQLFIVRDFYETNSIPYQRYTYYGFINLFDLASELSVRDGAKIVLDFLAAKFAVQSNELRRLVPFRRRLELDVLRPANYFGAHVDATAARMMLLTGMIDRVDDDSDPKETPTSRSQPRYGHAHLSAAGPLLIASLSRYRLPEAIRQRITNRHADDRLQVFNLYETNYDSDHLSFANEGVQISFSTPQFQLTAGGVPHGYGRRSEDLAVEWESLNGGSRDFLNWPYYHLYHDAVVSIVHSTALQNAGGVRPTSLMATLGSRRPNDLISFIGPDNQALRRNTCIAPNFICGLNPSWPQKLIAAGKCPSVSMPAQIRKLWQDNSAETGPMGCAVTKTLDEGGLPAVVFERGYAQLWGLPNGRTAVLAQWVEYDGKDFNRDRIVVRWRDAPAAWVYTVRPEVEGAALVPGTVNNEVWDQTAMGWTGGSKTIQPNLDFPNSKRWSFAIHGCKELESDANFNCSIDSPRISTVYHPLAVPVKETPPACDASMPELPSGASVLMLDMHGSCEPSKYGFYVALVLEPCIRGMCLENGNLFGFVEAAPAEQYRDFAAYQQDFRNRNGSRDYRFDRQNSHTLPSGETIDFVFVPKTDTAWAIQGSNVAGTNALATADIALWPRATGPFMVNDGKGRFQVVNQSTGLKLDYDWSNVLSPTVTCSLIGGGQC